MTERKYLPTFSELVDRLSIVILKSVFINQHSDKYAAEREAIEHDINLFLTEKPPLSAQAISAVLIIMLTNRFIWENESKARAGSDEQNHLLRLTHSVNGVRNTAKNVLSSELGERLDYKIDALAAELPPEYGHWSLWK